jgi:hypothetical protein
MTSSVIISEVDSKKLAKIRWTAACTALIVVPICLINYLELIFPALLFIGAVLARWWPQVGRGFMWVGVITVCLFVFPYCILLLFDPVLPAGHSDYIAMAITVGSIAGTILVPTCAILLLLDAISVLRKKRRARTSELSS